MMFILCLLGVGRQVFSKTSSSVAEEDCWFAPIQTDDSLL